MLACIYCATIHSNKLRKLENNSDWMMTSVVSTTAVTIYHAALVFFWRNDGRKWMRVRALFSVFLLGHKTLNYPTQCLARHYFFHKNHTLKVHWLAATFFARPINMIH